MRVLAICGSLRAASSNGALLDAAAQLAPDSVHVGYASPATRSPSSTRSASFTARCSVVSSVSPRRTL